MILLETNQLFVERTYISTDFMKLYVTGHLVCTCEGSRAGTTFFTECFTDCISLTSAVKVSRTPKCKWLLSAREDKAFIWQWCGWPSCHATSFESSRWPNNQVDEKCRTQKQPTFTFVVTITSRYITIFPAHWNVLQSRSWLAGHWMKIIVPIKQQICTWWWSRCSRRKSTFCLADRKTHNRHIQTALSFCFFRIDSLACLWSYKLVNCTKCWGYCCSYLRGVTSSQPNKQCAVRHLNSERWWKKCSA